MASCRHFIPWSPLRSPLPHPRSLPLVLLPYQAMFLESRQPPSKRHPWVRETNFELLGYMQLGHVGPAVTIGNLSTPKPPSDKTSSYKRAQVTGAPSHAEVTVSRMDIRHRLGVIAMEVGLAPRVTFPRVWPNPTPFIHTETDDAVVTPPPTSVLGVVCRTQSCSY